MQKPLHYLFGYGSLMYPSGINGRGMKHVYTWEDLQSATLHHFERGMFAEYGGLLYYGLMRKHISSVNGVILPIFTQEDLEALLKDEGAHNMYAGTKRGKMYEVINTSDYTCSTRNSATVLTLINEKVPEGKYITPQWYLAHVWKGIQPWGKSFSRKFLKAGGIKPAAVALKTSFIYTLVKRVKLWLR